MKTKKRFLCILLSLVMVLGLMPGMSLTAYAAAQYKVIGNAMQTPRSMPSDFMEVTEEEAWAYGHSFTETVCWLVIYAKDGNNYKFVRKAEWGEDKGTNTWENIINGESWCYPDPSQVSLIIPYGTPHAHSFTYSASGATITATCSADGCTLTDSKATLTIAAPTITTYGQTGEGISASATLTGLSDFNTATGKTIAATDIKYVGRDSTTYAESTTAPTDAGKYTAKITVEGKTASVNYEIAKADPTATAPTATATYGQTLVDVTLTNPDGNTAGTWAFVDAGTTSVGDVGSHIFKANFTPTSANYKTVENMDVTVTVGKAANPATVTGTPTVAKGGKTVDLATYVKLNGATGEVGYAISGDANGCSLEGSVLTSGDNEGRVTVNVTVAEDDKYNALDMTPITVNIADNSMAISVKFIHIKSDGSYGVPDDIKAITLEPTILIKDGAEIAAQSDDFSLEVAPGDKDKSLEVQFNLLVEKLESGMTVELSGLPAAVEKDIYNAGGDTPTVQLRYRDAHLNNEEGITVYLVWGSDIIVDETSVVHILPEDEIGAYKLLDDGTKEYLLFHTYDICMRYLGRDELCRGPERCFHKEHPYVNLFVK